MNADERIRLGLTESLWKRLKKYVNRRRRRSPNGQPPRGARRMTDSLVEAMVYVLRKGILRRELPGRFRKWSGVCCHWRNWTTAGLTTLFFDVTGGS